MCILSIDNIEVSRELLTAFGTAQGTDCDDITCTLTLLDAAGQSLWESTQPAEWVDTVRWKATFPLTAERRRYLCETRFPGDPPPPAFRLSATCPNCLEPARFARRVACCPTATLLPHKVDDACQDPDSSGLLLRRLTVHWSVARGAAAGDIDSQALVDLPNRTLAGQLMRLPDGTATQNFDEAFFVPPGEALNLRIKLVGFETCAAPSATVEALPACACSGQPASSQRFVVRDGNGDLSQSVADGRCVSATRVTVTAPADAQTARFEWLPPAQADANAPFSTTVDVPDTDEGVTVVARIGSAPCAHERSVTVIRCQARPGFCGWLPFSCAQIEAMWMMVFYVASFACYVGVSLLSGSGVSWAVDRAAAAVGTAAIAIGLGFTLGGLISYFVWLFLVIYWLLCCAPRSQCRFLRSFCWLLMWIGFTLPFWALLVLVVGLLAQLKLFTLAGIGVGSLFSFIFTVLLTGIVMLFMKWFRCPIPNPFDLPPVLSEDSP